MVPAYSSVSDLLHLASRAGCLIDCTFISLHFATIIFSSNLAALPLDSSRVLIPSFWYKILSSPWFVSILHNSGKGLITSTFFQLSCHARDMCSHQIYPELALGLNHASQGNESWWVAWYSFFFTTKPWSHWQKNVVLYAHFSFCKFGIKENFRAIIIHLYHVGIMN